MQTVLLRAEIAWPNYEGATFERFLPLSKITTPVQIATAGLKVAVVVDPAKHRGWVTDLDLEHVDKTYGMNCTGVYIEMSAEVEDPLFAALKSENANSSASLREFGELVAETVESVHDSLIEFLRSEHGQHWIPRRRPVVGPLHQRLPHYDTRWRDAEGWRLLAVNMHEPVVITAQMTNSIGPEHWAEFHTRLAGGGYRARPHRRLIANAFSHLANLDLRAAIVEAVAAWEMVLNQLGPRVLARSEPAYSENEWQGLVEKAGLRASSQLFFALCREGGLAKHRAGVLDAVMLRNTVVHQGQYRLDEQRVHGMLLAVRATLRECESVLPTSEAST